MVVSMQDCQAETIFQKITGESIDSPIMLFLRQLRAYLSCWLHSELDLVVDCM